MSEIVIVASAFGVDAIRRDGHRAWLKMAAQAGAAGFEVRRELFAGEAQADLAALRSLGEALAGLGMWSVYSVPATLYTATGALDEAALRRATGEADALGARFVKLQLGGFSAYERDEPTSGEGPRNHVMPATRDPKADAMEAVLAESGAAKSVSPKSGPAESGPAESGPAESGPAKSGPAKSGPAKSGPAKPGGAAGNMRDPSFERSAAQGAQIAACMRGARARLVVENGQLPEGGLIRQFVGLFDALRHEGYADALGMTFDLGNWQWPGESPVEAARQLAQYVEYIHCKAVTGVGARRFAVAPAADDPVCAAVLPLLPRNVPRGIEFPFDPDRVAADASRYVDWLAGA